MTPLTNLQTIAKPTEFPLCFVLSFSLSVSFSALFRCLLCFFALEVVVGWMVLRVVDQVSHRRKGERAKTKIYSVEKKRIYQQYLSIPHTHNSTSLLFFLPFFSLPLSFSNPQPNYTLTLLYNLLYIFHYLSIKHINLLYCQRKKKRINI